MKNPRLLAMSVGLLLAAHAAQADTGKLLLTGGVSSIGGAAGAGSRRGP